MSDEETMEVTEDYSALAQLGERDRLVKESVVAYLMWHSGEVLSKADYPSRESRANRIDELGEQAMDRFRESDRVKSDSRRVLASKSIFTQARAARDENPSTIVCYLDASMIMEGAMIPTLNIDGDEFNLATPQEMSEIGFNFRDFDTFRQKYIDLGTFLITDPMTVMNMFEHLQGLFLDKSITNFTELTTFHTIVPHWNIVGLPDECGRSFENMSLTYDTGKTIKIQGQVSEVGDAMVVFTKIAFRCRAHLTDEDGHKTDYRCNHINLVPQNVEDGIITKPHECEACGAKNNFVKLDSDKSRIEPIQRIQLSELQISEEPKSIMVEFRGNLVKQVRAGSTVEITGVLRLESITKNSTMSSIYILGQSISVISEESFTTILTEEQTEEVKMYADSFDFEDRLDDLVEQWIGQIKVDNNLKNALMLQLIGSPSNDSFGHRQGIHIMIAGDPGTAKSLLLKEVAKTAKGGRYVVAENLSQAGLTGACSQVEDLYTGKKRWSILPGALALTPKESICSVDEFNLYKGDFGDFNNALESGFVTINKIVKGTVYTECSVLTGCNPNGGNRKKFIEGEDYIMQLKLDITVLQRFDGIFVILDTADEENDETIAYSMLDEEGASQEVREFIQRYIAVAKTYCPEMSDEAKKYIAEQHAKKRQQTKSSDYMRSHRQVASLKRFALAAARFDFADEVKIKHVKFAESILEGTLNEQDPGAVVGAGSKGDREMRQNIARKVVEFITSKNQYEDIHIDFLHPWMEEGGFKIDKKELATMLHTFSKNSDTGLKRNADGTFDYNGSMNPVYSMW